MEEAHMGIYARFMTRHLASAFNTDALTIWS